MQNFFSFHQKCRKNQCNFLQHFKIPLSNYDWDGKCVFDDMQKILYTFLCSFCKMVIILDFEKAAAENAIIYLKNRQHIIKLRRQIKDEKVKREEKRKQRHCIRTFNIVL